jgi:RimJ/RimL family protein N-acetyltransferase
MAVIEGTSPGRIWVNEPINPQSAFMFATEGAYLAGNPDVANFNRSLKDAFQSGSFFEAWVKILYFVYHPDGWRERLTNFFDNQKPIERTRRHYVCYKLKYDWRAALPMETIVRRIDLALLNSPKIEIPDHLQEWMGYNWGSINSFLENGFGHVCIYQNNIVSWSLADCISGEACEIGIHTAEEHRRSGFGAIATAANVEYAQSIGLSCIGWQCDAENTGSFRTAEKVGFELEREYVMVFVKPYD